MYGSEDGSDGEKKIRTVLIFDVKVLRVGGGDSRRKVRAQKVGGEGSGDVEDVTVVQVQCAFTLGDVQRGAATSASPFRPAAPTYVIVAESGSIACRTHPRTKSRTWMSCRNDYVQAYSILR